MANNEVIIDGEVVLTVRDTTAEEPDVLTGKKFTQKDGSKGTGSLTIPPDYTGSYTITANGTVPINGKKATADITVNVPSKAEQSKTVELSMASGNQTISPDSGYALSQVIVNKPATMLPENIKKDINIGGIIGALESGGGGGGIIPVVISTVRTDGVPYCDGTQIIAASKAFTVAVGAPPANDGYSTYVWGVNSSSPTFAMEPGGYGSGDAGHYCILKKDGTTTDGYMDAGAEQTFQTSNVALVTMEVTCFVYGTLITLADGSKKAVQDITYDDDILTFNFDENRFESQKPYWIAKECEAPLYWNVELSNGTKLGLVGANGKCHRLFNEQKGKFVYPQDFNEYDRTFTEHSERPYIVKCEKVIEPKKYYNFATNKDNNCFANGVLCGNRFSNVYPIDNMRFIKDDRVLHTREEYAEIPDKYFYGLRLAEQPIMDNDKSNVNYFATMKEHIIHNYIEHEKNYDGKKDYVKWLFKK